MTATEQDSPVVALIRREIEAPGMISFARFMELALYAPGAGFYEREPTRLGRGGDFYTSVSVGSLCGELLAFQFAEWAREAEQMPEAGGPRPLQIVEAGAHDGRLAADLLGWLRRQQPELFKTLEYWIAEPSEQRREWQRQTLAPFAPRVKWAVAVVAIPDAGYRIVFCNELLDALPAHRLGWDADAQRWFEWSVGWEQGRFVWARSQLDAATASAIPPVPQGLLSVLPDGYTIEVCPAAMQWWAGAATSLRCGKIVAIDYGLTAEERFVPHRLHGTLRAYRRHHPSGDLLAAPGEQDLTAHVDFTALRQAGEAAGLRTESLVSQRAFLTRTAAQAWAKPESFGEWTPHRTRQFQTLTHPEHLGRAFQVLVQTR